MSSTSFATVPLRSASATTSPRRSASRSSGPTPTSSIKYYMHVGEAAEEQTIRLIGGDGKTMQKRYDRALEYLDSIAEKRGEFQDLEGILRGSTQAIIPINARILRSGSRLRFPHFQCRESGRDSDRGIPVGSRDGDSYPTAIPSLLTAQFHLCSRPQGKRFHYPVSLSSPRYLPPIVPSPYPSSL
jgi:hypothetical protein